MNTKAMKNHVSLLLVVALLFTLCPVKTMAETTENDTNIYTTDDGIYEYKIINSEITITHCNPGDEKELSIPDNIDGISVTSIGTSTFYGCSSLGEITIPNSVISIGANAFLGCKSLSKITIPNSVTSIGECAFRDCSGLGEITISNRLTSIGNFTFYDCINLNKITIPNSVTSIGGSAFYGCSGLTEIIIPNSVTGIGWYAFWCCRRLREITIPNSLISVGEWAFDGCDSLKDIYYSSSQEQWEKINMASGNECLKNATIHFDSDKTNSDETITTDDGIYEYKIIDSEITITGCNPGEEKKLSIPDNIKGISVTSIGKKAFNNCNNLREITIPNSVVSIGASAFWGCSSLSKIIIPNRVTNIDDNTFESCSSLVEITIPNSVTSIGASAFLGCSSLSKITIPNSVISIGANAFRGCKSLSKMTIPNSVTSIGDSTFRDCSRLGEITISNRLTSIGNFIFYDCINLSKITIPNSVTSIGASAFNGCNSLTEITIPNSVTSIGWYAFWCCRRLREITIPNSLTGIGQWAFDGCDSLKDVYYSSSQEQWEKINMASGNDCLKNATIHFNSDETIQVATNNSLAFSIYDGANTNLMYTPLRGATITIDNIGTAQTDKNGTAVIQNTITDKSVVNEKVSITKSGYRDYIFYQDIYNKDVTDWITNPGKISVLMTPLKAGEDTLPYVSTVSLQAGSTTVRNTLDTEYTFDSRDSIRSGDIRINAVWNGKTPKSYRIYSEDEKKSYSSADGTFQFDMLNAFSSGSPIWVELIATDGTSIKEKTKIKVKKYISGSTKKKTLTLAEAETGSSIGNDIPMLSGQSIDFKLSGISMSASVSAGKVRIMVGTKKKLADSEVFSEEEWENWKKACQLQPYDLSLSQWNNLTEAYDISVTSNTTAKADIYGYLEGTLNNAGDTIVSGVIKLNASMSAGVKGQYWVSGIPVYANVSLVEKATASGKLSYNWTQLSLDKDATELSFTITPALQAEAGVGVMAVATVGVSGEGSLPIKTKVGKSDAVNVSLKGKMSIKTSILGFNSSLDIAENTWQLYPENGIKALKSSMQANDFEVADRSYLNNKTKWTGEKTATAKMRRAAANGNNIESVLEQNIYPDSQLQIVETDNTRMIVWTDDDRTRESVDRSKLVYSIYDEQSGWSQPQAVVDDGTADYSPTVIADNSHIYVAWQNNKKAYGTDANLSDVAKETEICMSVWDDSTNSFSKAIKMSSAGNAAYSPKMALNASGNPYVAYITNTAGNPFLTEGKNNIEYAVYDGSTVENTVISSDIGLVTSFSTKYTDNYEVSYTLDKDGDYSTLSDRELYTVKNGSTINSSKNTDANSNIQYKDWNGKTYSFWYADGSIIMADNSGKQTTIYTDTTGLLTDNFSIITGNDSQLAVIWTAAYSEDDKQIQGILYDVVSGKYTQMVQLSNIEGDISQPSGVFMDDGSILFVYKKDIDGETDLCTYSCKPVTDLSVENAYCEEGNVIPGQKASVNVEVKNNGIQAVKSYGIDIGGTKTEFSDILMPGESKIVTAYYNVPEVLNYGMVDVTVESAEDENSSNDKFEMPVGYTDIGIKVTDNNLGNGHLINVEASNDSYVDANAKLNIYTESTEGTLVKSIDLGDLSKDSVTTVDYMWNEATEGYQKDISALYFVLETDSDERYTNNNYDFIAIVNDTDDSNGDEEDIKISSLSMNQSNASIKTGETLQLSATINPDNATNQNLTWTSDNSSVATVDQNGLVVAVGVGKTTIHVKAQDGSGAEALCVVEVTGNSSNDGGNSGNTDNGNSGNPDNGNSGNTDNGNPDNPDNGNPGNPDNGNPGNTDNGNPGNPDNGNSGNPDTNNNSGSGNSANGGNSNSSESNNNNTANSYDDSNNGNSNNGNNDNGNGNSGNAGSIGKTNFKVGDSVKIGDVTYKIINVKKKEVSYSKTKSKSSKITVPSTIKISGEIYKVTQIGDNAFKNNKRISKVVIGKNVSIIGKNAFNGCTKLKSLTIPSNVSTIGASAFSGTKKLTTITITSKKLTKKSVKNSLKGSYIKTIKLKGNAKKYYKKYVSYFQKKNSGRKVKIAKS